MVDQVCLRVAVVAVVAAFIMTESSLVSVSARYLPTRSQDDRLDRLRDLLKDMLESDYEHDRHQQAMDVGDSSMRPALPVMYKRAVEYPRTAMNFLAPKAAETTGVARHSSFMTQ